MSIRIKILSGFIVLSLMLIVAGIWSIYELNSIGTKVRSILDDNYGSIHAAKEMKEALEREDSAILLLLLGKWKEGRTILASADSLFDIKWEFAARNITIEGEHQRLQAIKSKYDEYKKLWERPIVDTDKEGNLDWYFNHVHHSFEAVKHSIDALINLNDRSMYNTAVELENKSNRAIMPGIVAISAALIFTFLFTYLINYYIVSPIIRITNRTNQFKEKRMPYDVKIETDDEIKRLSDAIEHLCLSVKMLDVPR